MESPAPEGSLSNRTNFPDRKFVLILAIAAVLIAALPSLIAMMRVPAGGAYLGFQYATDDHMVYSAWMQQAVEGRFLFDNRFTTDPQPGLTIHLYFLVLGWIAKFTGIAVASNLSRLVFSFLFVGLAYRLIVRLGWEATASKLALGLSIVGGGIGFFVWHTFGEVIVTPSPLGGAMLGRLPTDVWQPEGFVMASMLTNGLFMVSLCLMLVVFGSYLNARESSRAVLPGALALGVLMNIHSYDVLIIGLVMVAFAASSAARRQLTRAWVGRAVLITLGVVPAALWFVHVLRNDAVFQARAATETFSPNFRAVFFGYLPLIVLALVAIGKGSEVADRKRALAGVGIYALLLLGLFFAAASHTAGYFLTGPSFAIAFLVAVAASVLASGDRPAWNLLVAWAFVGTIAIYFPGLFQRKLAMGLSFPWAILAGYGLYCLVKGQDRTIRLLATAVGVLLFSATSLRWLQREIAFVQANCSRTSVQPVFLTDEMQKIVTALADTPGRRVVFAFPGIRSAAFNEKNEQEIVTGEALSPPIPDLNAIATGLTGAYTYAGHWSETPDYNRKRGLATQIFLSRMPEEERLAFLRETGATHIITPAPESLPELPLYDFRALGETVVDGSRYRLIRLR